jgi:hypothetical protein
MMPPDNVISMAEQTNSGRSAMRKHMLTCLVLVAVAALCVAATINGTTAGSFTRGCAARDLQILKVIEERENANAISAERLSDAMLAMLNARMTCYEGHVVDALAIYDSVVGSLTPDELRRSMSSGLTADRAR